MKLHSIEFKGFFQDETDEVAQQLQLAEPENDLERDLLSSLILSHNTTITEGPARRGYVFSYDVGDYLERGLYVLKLGARDASDQAWEAHIAAGVVVSPLSAHPARSQNFAPHWLLSERLHFKTSDDRVRQRYGGSAFGKLQFGNSNILPHRRLFRATA